MDYSPSSPDVKEILSGNPTVAVVGLSDDPSRPSYGVAAALQRFGMKVIPVNPNLSGPVLGEIPYPDLLEIPHPVDVVDVFRRSESVPPIARDAVEVGAKLLWMQLGVVSPEAAEYAAGNGLSVVMDRCLKVEYTAMFPG